MDELTIGDKMYISSKRAAKITGYAKDYVGQLCREGRVEARLVGRSWYVLETAIREHRFGGGAGKSEPIASLETDAEPSTAIWEAPRYVSEPEVSLMPVFPSVKPPETAVAVTETTPAVSMMQDAWKEWFEARERALPQNEEEKAAEDALPVQPEVDLEEPVELPEQEIFVVRATDISNEYNTFAVSHEETRTAPIPQSSPEVGQQLSSLDEEERVPLTISRPEPPPVAVVLARAHASGGVIDLSRRAPAAPIRTNGRTSAPVTRKSRSRVNSIQAVLVAVAGTALITALIGSGVMDTFLSQRGIDTSVRGHVFDFVRGESEIKK